jgi:hypothetical protein
MGGRRGQKYLCIRVEGAFTIGGPVRLVRPIVPIFNQYAFAYVSSKLSVEAKI